MAPSSCRFRTRAGVHRLGDCTCGRAAWVGCVERRETHPTVWTSPGRAVISARVPDVPSQGGVSCRAMTISTTCLAFEVTRKRRRGLSVRNARAPRRSHRPRRQGADRETRAQRSVPVRLRKKLSRNVACAPVASTAANASIMCAIEACNGWVAEAQACGRGYCRARSGAP